jgi:predicted transposase/invertase (TIGR01784 family)
MKRDSIFYRLFKQSPELLFDLIDPDFPNADRYRFESIEVKETAFRIDGVFLPPDDAESKVLFFSEVQLQKKENLYKRFFAEIFVSLHRAEVAYDDWGGVLIFGSRSMEPSSSVWYRSLLESPQIFRIYLDEIEQWQNPPLAIELILLAMSSETETPDRARALLDRSEQEGRQQDMLELISTIMMYRFPKLSWEAVAMMLDIQDVRLEDTRIYQEIAEKRDKTVKSSFLLELLTSQLGDLPETVMAQVSTMSPERLSDFGKAMFGVQTVEQLEAWLAKNR